MLLHELDQFVGKNSHDALCAQYSIRVNKKSMKVRSVERDSAHSLPMRMLGMRILAVALGQSSDLLA